MHFGQLQSALLARRGLQPLPDLLPVRQQSLLDFPRTTVAGRTQSPVDRCRQLFCRLLATGAPAQLRCRRYVPSNGLPAVLRMTGDRRLALPSTEPS